MSQSVGLLKGPMTSLLWMPVHTPKGIPTHEVSPRRDFLNGVIIIQPVHVSSFTLPSLWHLLRAISTLIVVCSVGIPIYLPENLPRHRRSSLNCLPPEVLPDQVADEPPRGEVEDLH